MPKLPDANDLNRVGYDAVRRFVPIPDVNIEGAYNRLATGLSNLGTGIQRFADTQQEEYRKAERFNTNIQLLEAESKYNEEASKLDPLSPDYQDKVVATWDNAVKPILTGLKDGENKRSYGEKLLENRFTLKSGAQKNQDAALSEKANQDIQTFIDQSRKKLRSDLSEDPENIYQSVNQMIDDAPLKPEQKARLKREFLPKIDQDALENTALRIRSGADATGGYFGRLRQIESGNNPRAYNKNSGASGLYQIIPSTARAYGVSNPFDVGQSENFIRRFTEDNAKVLRKVLGREPSAGELYLAHQQGAGGATKLLANPNARAIDVVGGDAIRWNGGRTDMTAGEFANMWISRFEGVEGPDGSPYIPVTNDYVISQIMETPQFKRLPMDDQDAVMSSISSQLKKMDDEDKLAKAQQKIDTKSRIEADLRSIEETGQPDESLTFEQVASSMTPQETTEWQQSRQEKKAIWDATSNFYELPDTEIVQAIDQMRDQVDSVKGTPQYGIMSKVIDAAEKKHKELQALRKEDPSQAAFQQRAVQSAYEQYVGIRRTPPQEAGSPEERNRLITDAFGKYKAATEEAQMGFGRSRVGAAIVPNETAEKIAGLFLDLPSTISTPGEKSQARDVLARTYTELKNIYGDYADDVIAYSLARYKPFTKETSEMMVSLLSSAAKGKDIRRPAIDTAQRMQDADQSDDGLSGFFQDWFGSGGPDADIPLGSSPDEAPANDETMSAR